MYEYVCQLVSLCLVCGGGGQLFGPVVTGAGRSHFRGKGRHLGTREEGGAGGDRGGGETSDGAAV
jgi:hypothetical protein